MTTQTAIPAGVFRFSLNLEQMENLLWVLAEWGCQPATHKESVTSDKFNELVQTLVCQARCQES